MKNSGHRAGLLVVQLQGDSLQGGQRGQRALCPALSELTYRTIQGDLCRDVLYEVLSWDEKQHEADSGLLHPLVARWLRGSRVSSGLE